MSELRILSMLIELGFHDKKLHKCKYMKHDNDFHCYEQINNNISLLTHTAAQ